MNNGRDGNRRNRGGGGRGRGFHTPVSNETRQGQVPSVPEENLAPFGGQGSQPPTGPRAMQPSGFGVSSSSGSSGSQGGHFPNQPRAMQPGGFGVGPSSGSSGSQGGHFPNQPRAIQPRGGYRGRLSTGGTRGGSRAQLGSDVHTDGDPIFKPPDEQAPPEPDPDVTAKEDEYASSSGSTNAKASGQDLGLPLRPSYSGIPKEKGKGDDHFVLRTNYLGVTFDLKKDFFRYDVTIEPASAKTPALKNIRKRRQVYNILFGEADFHVLRHGFATDYAETLITYGRLYEQSLPRKRYEVVYRNELEGPPDDNEGTQPDGRKYRVTVTFSGMVPIAELIEYIGSRSNNPSNFDARPEAIQAMNIIVAGSPNKDGAVFQAGQNKFFEYPRGDPTKPFSPLYDNCDLGSGLIAVRGYYSSIRTSTSRILLNLNAQCSAFYPEINLLDLMHIFAGERPIPEWKFPELEAFIRRLRVSTLQVTGERKQITRQKTVWGFSHKYEKFVHDKKPVPDQGKPPKMTGTKGVSVNYGSSDSIEFLSDIVPPPKLMSVSKYFFERYGLKLKSPEEPVVNCGTDESPEWIPPERLTVMPGQPYRGTLSDLQTTNMLTIAARGPAENARRITNDGVKVIGIQPQSETLGAFGISISPKMLTVHGRLLSAPRIQYRQTTRMPGYAEWNLLGNQFHKTASMQKWAVLCLGGANIPASATGKFQEILGKCGMGSSKPEGKWYRAQLLGVGDDDVNDGAIKTEMKNVEEAKIPILLVVLKTASAAIYARVKYWGDITNGIHTVCVLEKKLLDYDQAHYDQAHHGKAPPGDGAYWANVLHKFNLKLGGINHCLEHGLPDLPEKTMVVGIDVAHPAPASMENAPSVVAMVASMNNACVHFPGSVRIQENRQEIQKLRKDKLEKELGGPPDGKEDMVDSSNIRALLEERLRLYRGNNQEKLPENILIYRDGVSESQYQAVLDLELKPIQGVCEKIYSGKNSAPPKITIVIVGKRHHTRFYPTDEAHADTKHGGKLKLCNPLNGTVVDRGITMHKGWDFYLQAHSAIKGTAKPAHYIVIHDDIGLEAAQVEKITHNLSYLYQRATKAVSYCTPAYYADLLCARGRAWLMKAVRRKDSETKFDFSNANNTNPETTAHFRVRNSMFYV